MFQCEGGHVTTPGQKMTRVVVQQRRKVYPARPSENDPGGVGLETVREAKLCGACAEALLRPPTAVVRTGGVIRRALRMDS